MSEEKEHIRDANVAITEALWRLGKARAHVDHAGLGHELGPILDKVAQELRPVLKELVDRLIN